MEYDQELDRRVNYANNILTPLGFKRVCALDPIDPELVGQFRELVENSDTEKPLQKFLWKHPVIFARFLGPGFCWWIKQEVRLGNEVRMDFLAARTESLPLNYTMVELESPTARWFNPSNRRPAEKMVEAIQQVGEWRYWINKLQHYINEPKPYGGGLSHLSSHTVNAQIVIGRRAIVTNADRERVKALMDAGNRFSVNTWDTLIERSRNPAWNIYGQSASDCCEECSYIN